jgi:hypothetical protein
MPYRAQWVCIEDPWDQTNSKLELFLNHSINKQLTLTIAEEILEYLPYIQQENFVLKRLKTANR